MSKMENWKPVKGYEGIYEVSDLGNVRSLDKEINHNFYKGVKFVRKGKILIPFISDRGYLRVTLIKDGKRKKVFVHRLVAEAFIESDTDGLQVNHIDGNKSNNTVGNLEWCTGRENMHHAFDSGLFDEAIKRKSKAVIRDDGVVFTSISDAAKETNLCSSMVSDTVNNKRKDAKGRIFKFI